MSIKYTASQVLDQMQSSFSEISSFYREGFLNYTGLTSDTNEYYTEVIAKFLIGHIDLLDQISPIIRGSNYKTETHNGYTASEQSNRKEERLAMAMFLQKGVPNLGLIMDYQTPLKNKQTDKAGKIDLLSYDGTILRLLELKTPESKETMLRCLLEGYTYLKTVDKNKLLENFHLPKETTIKACPLVSLHGLQHQEVIEKRPYLTKLMKILDCEPVYYYQIENHYIAITKQIDHDIG